VIPQQKDSGIRAKAVWFAPTAETDRQLIDSSGAFEIEAADHAGRNIVETSNSPQ
jgi:hypothetical protein